MHVVLQTLLQQTPSAHAPLAHSPCVVHAAPRARPTHMLFVHTGAVAGQSAAVQQAGAALPTHRFVPGQLR
jgi:hypothetical protein